MSGWIKLHRKFTSWEWFTDVSTCHLFMYCVLRANHEDKKWRGQSIKRGEFVTSLATLAKETGLTVRQVRTSQDKLILTGEVTIKTSNKYRIISVTNYNFYQDIDKQDDKQATNKRQTNDKQATTDKNNKNYKNYKNEKENNISTPDWLPQNEWQDFLTMRKEIKKPVTPTAAKLIIMKLNNLRIDGNTPAKVLARSVENNWQGVFELPEAEREKVIKPGQSIMDMPMYKEIMGENDVR